MHTFLIRL